MTRQVNAGGLLIGGGAPVSIQSMTNTKTGDASATLAQIMALAGAGCQLVRVAANDKAAAAALPALAAQSPVPLCADVHFDVNMAVAALEAGFAKVRINPGNLGGPDKVRRLCHCLRAHHAPVRAMPGCWKRRGSRTSCSP
jgi:(E)-4-hydroxy-3-methylbut-2-enyl-diphosphate synthase